MTMSHDFKHLTEKEFAALSQVCTTTGEAAQIINRCQELLALLDNQQEGHVCIGCPHCESLYKCASCAYPAFDANAENSASRNRLFQCCKFTFADLTLHNLCTLEFSSEDAEYFTSYPELGERPSLCVSNDEDEERDNVRKFLLAHIEWTKHLQPSLISWRMMSDQERKLWKLDHWFCMKQQEPPCNLTSPPTESVKI